MPKVFISYSHDPGDHPRRVLELSDRLRGDGIDCTIDQYINGSPPQGWQRWMEQQIEAADFVLVICTELYLKRFKGEDREGGRGVNFESLIISQVLYDAFQQNTKFYPVIPDDGSLDYVPLFLKSGSTYKFNEDYESLYRVLTDQPRAIAKSLGKKKHFSSEQTTVQTKKESIKIDRLPTVIGDFFGREAELKLLDDALQNERTDTRIIQFIAAGGTGKTKLLRHWLNKRVKEIGNTIVWSCPAPLPAKPPCAPMSMSSAPPASPTSPPICTASKRYPKPALQLPTQTPAWRSQTWLMCAVSCKPSAR